jgi:hypothetical protein
VASLKSVLDVYFGCLQPGPWEVARKPHYCSTRTPHYYGRPSETDLVTRQRSECAPVAPRAAPPPCARHRGVGVLKSSAAVGWGAPITGT